MGNWLKRHWHGFWRAAPGNVYAFITRAVLMMAVIVFLSAGSSLLKYVPARFGSFALMPKWQDRFLGAFGGIAILVLVTLIPIFVKRLLELERTPPGMETVYLRVPITVPRGSIKQRIVWKRVIMWLVIFSTMQAAAIRGGFIKVSFLFVLASLLMLINVGNIWWRNK